MYNSIVYNIGNNMYNNISKKKNKQEKEKHIKRI